MELPLVKLGAGVVTAGGGAGCHESNIHPNHSCSGPDSRKSRQSCLSPGGCRGVRAAITCVPLPSAGAVAASACRWHRSLCCSQQQPVRERSTERQGSHPLPKAQTWGMHTGPAGGARGHFRGGTWGQQAGPGKRPVPEHWRSQNPGP